MTETTETQVAEILGSFQVHVYKAKIPSSKKKKAYLLSVLRLTFQNDESMAKFIKPKIPVLLDESYYSCILAMNASISLK